MQCDMLGTALHTGRNFAVSLSSFDETIQHITLRAMAEFLIFNFEFLINF